MHIYLSSSAVGWLLLLFGLWCMLLALSLKDRSPATLQAQQRRKVARRAARDAYYASAEYAQRQAEEWEHAKAYFTIVGMMGGFVLLIYLIYGVLPHIRHLGIIP